MVRNWSRLGLSFLSHNSPDLGFSSDRPFNDVAAHYSSYVPPLRKKIWFKSLASGRSSLFYMYPLLYKYYINVKKNYLLLPLTISQLTIKGGLAPLLSNTVILNKNPSLLIIILKLNIKIFKIFKKSLVNFIYFDFFIYKEVISNYTLKSYLKLFSKPWLSFLSLKRFRVETLTPLLFYHSNNFNYLHFDSLRRSLVAGSWGSTAFLDLIRPDYSASTSIKDKVDLFNILLSICTTLIAHVRSLLILTLLCYSNMSLKTQLKTLKVFKELFYFTPPQASKFKNLIRLKGSTGKGFSGSTVTNKSRGVLKFYGRSNNSSRFFQTAPLLLYNVTAYTSKAEHSWVVWLKSSAGVVSHLKVLYFSPLQFFFSDHRRLFTGLNSHTLSKILLFTKPGTRVCSVRDVFKNWFCFATTHKSFARILFFDGYKGLFNLKLPSGSLKFFFFLSRYTPFRHDFITTLREESPSYFNAGAACKTGRQPKVRGVAKNPVDHPHGGNTKSIRLPRTPWGFVTKKK